MLDFTHSTVIAGSLGNRRMYESLRKEFYYPHMETNVFTVANDCTESTRMSIKFDCQRKLELFTPTSPLEFVAIDYFGTTFQYQNW